MKSFYFWYLFKGHDTQEALRSFTDSPPEKRNFNHHRGTVNRKVNLVETVGDLLQGNEDSGCYSESLKREFKSTLIDYLRVDWESYMIYGGYPAIVTEPDKQEKMNRLKDIRDSFVK